ERARALVRVEDGVVVVGRVAVQGGGRVEVDPLDRGDVVVLAGPAVVGDAVLGDGDRRLVLAVLHGPVSVDLVVVGAAVEHVGRGGVVVLVAAQRVVARAAAHGVGAALALQHRVVAGAAVDRVGAAAALELVRAVAAVD